MRVVITGATGFLGRALCREFTENGHQVTAVVRPESYGKAEGLEAETIIGLPLEGLGGLAGGYDVFLHLAWNGPAGEARNDYSMQAKNLLYMEYALQAAKRCGCGRFIGAGSQAEYGVIHKKAIEGETAPSPFMMYGAAKLACLHMGKVLAEQLGITFVWPRIYSVYGPRENDPTLLGYVARELRRGALPELSPCENMWDFLYITDFTKAMRLLAEHPGAEGVYHVASGKPGILRGFVEQMRDIIKPGAELGFGMRQADTRHTFWLEPDISRLEGLGFQCRVTFREGVRSL